MDLRKVKTLIDLVQQSGISELEIQEGEERVRISRGPIGHAGNAGGAQQPQVYAANPIDRKSTRLNSSHIPLSRMPSSA